MYLPYTSLSRLSNPYSCLTRIRLTISCFDDLLRGLPKLCHRLDARGVRMHSGLLESLSICHNVFRKYRMASLVKFACSVTPTRLARTMHKRCPLYLLAKSMVSRGSSYTGYIPWIVPLCKMFCFIYGNHIQGYSSWCGVFSDGYVKRSIPSRKSYYLCHLNQLLAQFCP